MYSRRTGLVFAFHGCDQKEVDEVIKNGGMLKPSENVYDWLGHGIYFWENSEKRALEYAKELSIKKNSTIKKPAVLGAVINLGYCLDLLDSNNLQLLKAIYQVLYTQKGKSLPKNSIEEYGISLFRQLDCFVIEALHLELKKSISKSNHTLSQEFDSVRGMFSEGKPLYENAGFREKDHIQICIRNPNCIKGFFLPRILDKKFPPV